MLSKIIKIFVILAGSASLIIALLFFTQEISTFFKWKASGVISTDFSLNDDSTMTFGRVDTTEFLSSPYPDSGDIILALDDTTASMSYIREKIYKGYPPGKQIEITYIHNSDTLQATLQTQPVDKSDIVENIPISLLRLLIVLGYLGVGFWALIKRPNSGAIHALTLYCIAMADFMMGAVSIGYDDIVGIEIPYYDVLSNVLTSLALFFGAFWLNLQLLFPKTHRLAANNRFLVFIICYLPILAFMILSNVIEIGYEYWGGIITVVIMIQVSAGFFFLASNHSKATDPLEKRQTRLVLWGSGIGLSGLLILALLILFLRDWVISLGGDFILGMVTLVFLGLLVSPISFAYAFGKYRLLEVEGKIRRGTRFAVVSVVLLGVFYIVIYGVSELFLTSLGIESRGPTLMIALLLAIGFTPAQRKVQSFAETRIYPERTRLNSMLRDFLSQASTFTEKEEFWSRLEEHLSEVMKIDSVYSILYNEQKDIFYYWRAEEATPFTINSSLINELPCLKGCPLMLDEAIASKRLSLVDEEQRWFTGRNVAMVLPLVTHSRLIGFLALGSKSGSEDFRAEDCSILMSIASQVAMAGENIMLVEENVEKRRLEAQLGIARKVQEGLLPEELPDTPGLKVSGKSRSCLEVAGDYYDVVNIDDNRTVLAIGDVSGKGAGAALLMSNLQASFRTAVDIGTGLADMVTRVNNLIHRNTKPDQFITFFVGVYDNSNSTFAYVNAGHNPPYVMRNDGRIEELDKGGLILGALPNMTYEQGTVDLNAGDLILLFTDGVSEAENAADDMFGEDRIIKFLQASAGLSVDDILRNLETEVEKFIEDVPLTDDFTALVARVEGNPTASS
ncbi:MAG: SpoIIE family protein phosphatase [candidate division Zixibacteria bacterium]|nr:SpoIIE family protein phosphatase [candidate division Zixibacteria bacterium]